MGLFDFYIDKRKKHKNDNYVNIILDYPIEVNYDEYLKVKLCDFKFLNNIYNISSTLMNNQFNIRRYEKTYTITGYTGQLFLTDTGFFDDQNALLVSETIDTTLHQSTITYNNTSLTYYNTSLITDDNQSYWVNILNDTPNTNRKMELQDSYGNIFEITSNEIIYSFDITFYKDQNISGSTTDIDIILQKYNTTTTFWDTINTQTLTFQNAGAQQISKTFTTTSPLADDKYHIVSNTGSIPFALYIIKLQANKQIPVFDAGTIGAPVQHTITIPDGFYKATNLKTTLNDLLSNYKLTASVDNITNKLKIANDNPTFVPTIDDLIDDNYQLDLVIPNIPNMLENWGITSSYEQYINVPFNSYYEGDTNINLINLSKIIITTNLAFDQKTHNELIRGNDMHRGFGNILCWIDADQAPMTCINYRNYEDLSYRISNRHVNFIRLSFYSEKSQPLHIDNGLVHLQIKKLQKKVI